MKKAEEMKGFTIIELMITLVVASILLSVGVPSFMEMMKNNRLATAANSLAASINFARSEAVARGVRTGVCADGSGCSSGGNWQQGWMVMVDQDNDGTLEQVVRVREELDGDITVTNSGGINGVVSFLDSGNGRSEQSGAIKLCAVDLDGNTGWNLVLGADGRLSVLGYAVGEKVACP